MTNISRWYRKWFLGWVECPTCDRLVPSYNFGIHSDGHFAQEMRAMDRHLRAEAAWQDGWEPK